MEKEEEGPDPLNDAVIYEESNINSMLQSIRSEGWSASSIVLRSGYRKINLQSCCNISDMEEWSSEKEIDIDEPEKSKKEIERD